MKTQYIILIVVVIIIAVVVYFTMLFPKSPAVTSQTIETTAGGAGLLSGISNLFSMKAIANIAAAKAAE